MSGRMSKRMIVALVVLFVAPFTGVVRAQDAEVEVIIELVPDQPGPYGGAETVTVDVWLHSQVSFDAFLHVVQLDFSISDQALRLGETFQFDLSSIPKPQGDFSVGAAMPVPLAGIMHGGIVFQEDLLLLPAEGSLHIGSLGVRLPATVGVYRLDALNRDTTDSILSAQIEAKFFPGGDHWRASEGDIAGGTFDFVVNGPPIPTVSEWGTIALGLLVLVAGPIVIRAGRRYCSSAGVFGVLFLLAPSGS